VQPIHARAGQHPASHDDGTMSRTFSGRFVNSCHSNHSVSSISRHSRARSSTWSSRSSNTSAIDAQNTSAGFPAFSAARFHFSGSFQCLSPNLRRSVVLPHTALPVRLANVSA